jgi:quercetin dioxygenase-like cupin family protein
MTRNRSRWIGIAAATVCACGGLALRMASATPGVAISTMIVSGPTRLEEVHVNTRNEAFDHALKLKTKGASDVYVVYNTIAPGGHTGWHSHPGPSIVSVKSGVATEYHGDAPGEAYVHVAGTSFIDDGEGPHLIRNEGATNLELVAFQVLPAGATRRIDEPAP